MNKRQRLPLPDTATPGLRPGLLESIWKDTLPEIDWETPEIEWTPIDWEEIRPESIDWSPLPWEEL